MGYLDALQTIFYAFLLLLTVSIGRWPGGKGWKVPNASLFFSWKDNDPICRNRDCSLCGGELAGGVLAEGVWESDAGDEEEEEEAPSKRGKWWPNAALSSSLFALWILVVTCENEWLTKVLENRNGLVGFVAWMTRPLVRLLNHCGGFFIAFLLLASGCVFAVGRRRLGGKFGVLSRLPSTIPIWRLPLFVITHGYKPV